MIMNFLCPWESQLHVGGLKIRTAKRNQFLCFALQAKVCYSILGRWEIGEL